ncbi:fucose-specific lectin [Sistotremastrum suecicum HHB10207 ss-3]|uniref:Fucose-specific lectin n=1 Tax=Sistotremastrum suecicum HHB10207 ss-3 TaxID=1314776 RepID=A0A166ARV6_9AGAM|nr:fucose-specific lectin [Sistotremastrum suecicum HHB10207 ss-3]
MSNIKGTGLAAIQWENNGLHLRVYHQHTDGFVYESALDDNVGGGWHSTQKLFQARLRSPLSAIVWNTSAGSPQIRVYYLDDQGAVQEYVYSGGWSKGASLPASNVSPITGLAAVRWSDEPQIRVYYQQKDNVIHEVVWSHGWSAGATLSAAFSGTAIAATTYSDSSTIRVYYQQADYKLHEAAWISGWKFRTLDDVTSPAGGIAAVGWLEGGHAPTLRVYSQSQRDTIQELSYDDPSGWVYPTRVLDPNVAPSDGSIAAVHWLNGPNQIRVYVQASGRNITELVWDGPSGRGWYSQVLNF